MNSDLTNHRTWGKHKNGNWEPTYTNKNSNQILFVAANSPEANYCGPVNNPSYSTNDTSSCTCSSNKQHLKCLFFHFRFARLIH